MSQELKDSTKRGSGVPWGWIAFGLLSVFVVGFFGWKLSGGAGQGFITYYLTVDEFVAEKAKYEGLRVKVAGYVQENSLERLENNDYRFVVEFKGDSIPVKYEGFAPDTFKEGAEVVIEGSGTLSDVFLAEGLMAKCASKYEMGGPMIEGRSPSFDTY